MRIVGGIFRGRALVEVGHGDAEAHLRPTSDRVRESIFNRLRHGGFGNPPPPENCHVLDLFAGTGALGLEALSRGAADVTFVDNGRIALSILEANIDRLSLRAATRVVRGNALRLGVNPGLPHDLVFLDPPYGKQLGEAAITSALRQGWIAEGALVVWEECGNVDPPAGLIHLDTRTYGRTAISCFRHGAA